MSEPVQILLHNLVGPIELVFRINAVVHVLICAVDKSQTAEHTVDLALCFSQVAIKLVKPPL